MLNLGAEQSSAAPLTLGRQEQATQVRFDSFFRMPMPAAITKFLEIAKSPQSVSDVTAAAPEWWFQDDFEKNLDAKCRFHSVTHKAMGSAGKRR